jgi:aldehyde dehydrogenase (NAD+)
MASSRIQYIHDSQKAFYPSLRSSNALERIDKLKKLKTAIKKYEPQIYAALSKDLRKSHFEAAVTELIFTYGEIDFAISNVRNWMVPKRVGKSLSNPFAKNRIHYEPKGMCLIISPWNYPFQLVMAPLVSAIAAGNCVIVKPSEISVHTSTVISKLLLEVFDEQEVACIEGPTAVSTELLALPFDHIFFTGSTAVGKVVMQAAAKNLTSVTLELGGKSPVVIDKNCDIQKAAKKIAWGKLVNCGQTCIAPDYALIHEDNIDEFIGYYKQFATEMYFGANNAIDKNVYGKVISKNHFERLVNLMNDAVDKGARINWGGKTNEQEQTIPPVVLTQLTDEMTVMKEEIFGPILPIIPYKTADEAIKYINSKSKPLALYIFSNNDKNIDQIIKNTSSGGTCVNDVLIHLANPKLPFGGVNHSGMGSSHGFFGFKNFSHERTVVTQRAIDFNSLIYPPYSGKNWVLKMLEKIM